MPNVKAAVARQLDATFRAISMVIEQVPAEHWRTGEIDYLIPARHVLHLLDTMVIGYFGGPPDWEAPNPVLGRKLDWEGTPAEELPDQTEMMRYFDHTKQHMADWMDQHDDEALLAPKEFCPWTGPNLLSHLIYNIRHNQGHIDIINAELRRRDLPRIKWQA